MPRWSLSRAGSLRKYSLRNNIRRYWFPVEISSRCDLSFVSKTILQLAPLSRLARPQPHTHSRLFPSTSQIPSSASSALSLSSSPPLHWPHRHCPRPLQELVFILRREQQEELGRDHRHRMLHVDATVGSGGDGTGGGGATGAAWRTLPSGEAGERRCEEEREDAAVT